MTSSLNDLPDCPEWTAKSLLAGLIKHSPLLAGKINFYSYSKEDGPAADASPDMLPRPFVRMSIRPQTSSWFGSGVMKYPFEAVIELGVDGLYDKPLLNLWHAVRMSLSPSSVAPGGVKTVREVMQGGRIAVSEMELAAYGLSDAGKGTLRFLYGLGYLHCEILMNS